MDAAIDRSFTPPASRAGLAWSLADPLAIARRILIRTLRSPEELASSTSTPIIFVLLFRYVFGGAIDVGHTGYANYLMAGVFVQTIAFTSLAAGTGVAQDLQSGLMDRFRSLPIGRSAVITGRVLATVVRSILTLALVVAVGLVVGFRPQGGAASWALALGLLLAFGFALSWVGIALALVVRDAESVQNLTMTLVFPLTFLSSAFVPAATMPALLRAFVANQPMTHVIDAVRALVLDRPAGPETWLALAWSAGIVAVFAPLAAFAYGRAARR
ncbi:MAG TPA: ABC transporter permease [Terriglobales bacterium]|nr:ABC transporter permease [Terriglobales bacterium]